jgi:hypothetical protein
MRALACLAVVALLAALLAASPVMAVAPGVPAATQGATLTRLPGFGNPVNPFALGQSPVDGALYILDSNNLQIIKLTLDGTETQFTQGGEYSGTALLVDAQNQVYVNPGQGVIKLSAAGQPTVNQYGQTQYFIPSSIHLGFDIAFDSAANPSSTITQYTVANGAYTGSSSVVDSTAGSSYYIAQDASGNFYYDQRVTMDLPHAHGVHGVEAGPHRCTHAAGARVGGHHLCGGPHHRCGGQSVRAGHRRSAAAGDAVGLHLQHRAVVAVQRSAAVRRHLHL